MIGYKYVIQKRHYAAHLDTSRIVNDFVPRTAAPYFFQVPSQYVVVKFIGSQIDTYGVLD